MPRKKLKGGKKNIKKISSQKSTLENDSFHCFDGDIEPLTNLKNWIENVNKNKDDFQIKDELEEIEEEFLNEEEFECNIKELEVN